MTMSNQNQIASEKLEKKGQPRILARQLARPLTNEELEFVSGAMRPRADTWCETGCPCSNDSGT
jgi:hypothetical protein